MCVLIIYLAFISHSLTIFRLLSLIILLQQINPKITEVQHYDSYNNDETIIVTDERICVDEITIYKLYLTIVNLTCSLNMQYSK